MTSESSGDQAILTAPRLSTIVPVNFHTQGGNPNEDHDRDLSRAPLLAAIEPVPPAGADQTRPKVHGVFECRNGHCNLTRSGIVTDRKGMRILLAALLLTAALPSA